MKEESSIIDIDGGNGNGIILITRGKGASGGGGGGYDGGGAVITPGDGGGGGSGGGGGGGGGTIQPDTLELVAPFFDYIWENQNPVPFRVKGVSSILQNNTVKVVALAVSGGTTVTVIDKSNLPSGQYDISASKSLTRGKYLLQCFVNGIMLYDKNFQIYQTPILNITVPPDGENTRPIIDITGNTFGLMLKFIFMHNVVSSDPYIITHNEYKQGEFMIHFRPPASNPFKPGQVLFCAELKHGSTLLQKVQGQLNVLPPPPPIPLTISIPTETRDTRPRISITGGVSGKTSRIKVKLINTTDASSITLIDENITGTFSDKVLPLSQDLQRNVYGWSTYVNNVEKSSGQIHILEPLPRTLSISLPSNSINTRPTISVRGNGGRLHLTIKGSNGVVQTLANNYILPPDTTKQYTPNSPLSAGDYLVTATLREDNVHTTQTATGKVLPLPDLPIISIDLPRQTNDRLPIINVKVNLKGRLTLQTKTLADKQYQTVYENKSIEANEVVVYQPSIALPFGTLTVRAFFDWDKRPGDNQSQVVLEKYSEILFNNPPPVANNLPITLVELPEDISLSMGNIFVKVKSKTFVKKEEKKGSVSLNIFKTNPNTNREMEISDQLIFIFGRQSVILTITDNLNEPGNIKPRRYFNNKTLFLNHFAERLNNHPDIFPFFEISVQNEKIVITERDAGTYQMPFVKIMYYVNLPIYYLQVMPFTQHTLVSSFANGNDREFLENYQLGIRIFDNNRNVMGEILSIPDQNGEITFDIADFVRDLPIQGYSNFEALEISTVACANYFFQVFEFIGAIEKSFIQSNVLKVIYGKNTYIKEKQLRLKGSSFFKEIRLEKSFLTLQPDVKKISTYQKELLSFLVYEKSYSKLYLCIKGFYKDSEFEEGIIQEINVNYGYVVNFNVVHYLHKFIERHPAKGKLVRFQIGIFHTYLDSTENDGSSFEKKENQYISPRTYIIDDRRYKDVRVFAMKNFYGGGLDTLKAVGGIEKNEVSIEKQFANHSLLHSNDEFVGRNIQIDIEKKVSFLLNWGDLSLMGVSDREWKIFLQQIELAEQVWEMRDKVLVPVNFVTKKYDLLATEDYYLSHQSVYEYAFSEDSYSREDHEEIEIKPKSKKN